MSYYSSMSSNYDSSLSLSGKIDAATGLYYYNARWYDAQTGRFISEDPARDGQNWYIYTSNNPIKYIDPTGMFNWDTVTKGLNHTYSGTGKLIFGAGLSIGLGGADVLTGGTATPLVAGGIIAGGVIASNGFIEAVTGAGIAMNGLFEDPCTNKGDNIPGSLPEMMSIAGDNILETISGQETNNLEKGNEFINGISNSKIDNIMNAQSLGNSEIPSEYREPVEIDLDIFSDFEIPDPEIIE